MSKQNFGSGLGKNGPSRQGDKGGKGGQLKKSGTDTPAGDLSASGKAGNGPGRKGPGISGGKRSHSTVDMGGKGSPRGKGSGNR